MKYCSKLYNDINFEPHSAQPCCNTHELQRLPSFPFNGGVLDMAEYAGCLQTSLRLMQSEGGMCAGCPDLVEQDPATGVSLSGNISFHTISLNMHRYLCNCRCVYCSLWETPEPAYPILPTLKSLAAQRAIAADCRFSWGGGEASILPEFEECAAWILRRAFFQYIHSNALRYSQVIEDILRSGLGALNVSLDSGSAKGYRAVKGVDQYDKVVDNLRRYSDVASQNDGLHLKYIVFEQNNSPEEIESFMSLCDTLCVKTVQLSLNLREVNKRTVSRRSLDSAALFLKLAAERGLMYSPFFLDKKYQSEILQIAVHKYGIDKL